MAKHLKKEEVGFDAPKSNKPEQQKNSKFISNSGASKNTCRKDVSNDQDDPDVNKKYLYFFYKFYKVNWFVNCAYSMFFKMIVAQLIWVQLQVRQKQ